MDDCTDTADETLSSPTPQWIEHQRQAALTALSNARIALRSGMIGTAETRLIQVEVHLRAMAPTPGAAK